MSFEQVIISLNRSELVHKFIVEKLSNTHFGVVSYDGVAMDSSPRSGDSGSLLPTSPRLFGNDQLLPMSPAPKEAVNTMVDLSKSCLGAATDLAQRSVAQLLSLRKDNNARLDINKMKFLWEISLQFVLSLEHVGGTTAYVIRQCLLTQTRSFLDRLHESMKGRLVNTLDAERWVQCDVSTDRQKEIDRLASGKAFLPPKSSSSSDVNSCSGKGANENIGDDATTPGDDYKSNTTSTAAGASKKKEAKPASVDGASFKVVWSAMLLTEIIMTYLDVSVSFSPVTTDVINKTVELLRLFDNRTRQLVLGAQAIQSAARLKSISAKHLAVTAQSIGLILALLPHVRTALLAQLPPKHHVQLTELDRISLALIDHHGQIVAKFVGIVGDFVDQSALKLRSMDWDRFQGQCEYFEEVQRNVSALHRVLSEALPAEQVQDVFSRIVALLNRRIPTHFEEVMPSTPVGRQRIIDEIVHLIAAFAKLNIFVAGTATAALEEAFRKKYGPSASAVSSQLADS
jgi:vacuolar protein sorting-associated protein 54